MTLKAFACAIVLYTPAPSMTFAKTVTSTAEALCSRGGDGIAASGVSALWQSCVMAVAILFRNKLWHRH